MAGFFITLFALVSWLIIFVAIKACFMTAIRSEQAMT